jgi:DNA-binding NarL/FixJ family response regulator
MPPRGKRASSSSSRDITQAAAESQRQSQTSLRLPDPLTPRELEILGLIAEGLFNREISDRLWLAEETVKTHIHHLLTKLGARSRAHAVAIGLRSGLIG